jgi:hypothetical protein
MSRERRADGASSVRLDTAAMTRFLFLLAALASIAAGAWAGRL